MNIKDANTCTTCKHEPQSAVESVQACETCEGWVNYEASSAPSALDVQVGGSHYKDFPIQPITFIHANKLDFIRGNIIKYACRNKDGAQDIRKIIHYAELLLELGYGEKP